MEKFEYNPISKELDFVSKSQAKSLPAASASELGKVYQYTGTTNANYTHGYFYECVSDGATPPTYSWQRRNVQPIGEGETTSFAEIGGNATDNASLATALNGRIAKVSCTYAVDEASQLSTKAHGAGYTCLCKGDGKIYTSDGTAWNGGVLGLLGVLYIAESETYVYDTNKFVLISTDNAKTLNGHNENYFAKESEAAKKSGSYPSMTVGSANNLNGYHKVNASYLRRTSAGSESIGSGVAQIRSLKGNSIVWNQKYNDIEPTSISARKYIKSEAVNGVVTRTYLTGDGNSVTYTADSTSRMLIDLSLMFGAGNEPATVEAFEAWCAAQGIDLDKYYPYNEGEVINCKADAIKTDGFNQYDNTTGNANVIKGNVYQITGTYTSLSLGGETITPDASGYFTPTISGELTVTGGDATTCVHLKWSGKKDGEFEQHWSEALNLNLTSITGKVNGVGASETIFPDGLVKVGNVADELVVDSDGKARRAIKRFGKVDLGSLTWSYLNTYFAANLRNSGHLYCCISSRYITGNVTTLDKAVTLSNINYVAVSDSDYTNVTTFKNAVSGVYLYYELAAPVNYTLDTPIDMTYRVDDFGTETAMVLSSGSLVDADITKTAPLNYDVVYSLNVVDTVRNLNRNYLGMTGTNNTFLALRTALSGYGITLTLGGYDETNGYYPVTISERWKPAAAAPETASANGTAGDYFVDTDYFYVCVATNTWKRFALSTW